MSENNNKIFNNEKQKLNAYCIYFNQNDMQKLIQLSKKQKLSKSAIIRKLIENAELKNLNINYSKIEEAFKPYNENLKEIFNEFRQIGININQIAKALNSKFDEDETIKDIKKQISTLQKALEKKREEIKQYAIKIEKLRVHKSKNIKLEGIENE